MGTGIALGRRSGLALLAAIIALMLAAAACGGSEEEDTPAVQATQAPAAQPTQAPAAQATQAPSVSPELAAIMAQPGYRAEWGEPQYGGQYFHGQPWPRLQMDDPQLNRLYNRHTTFRFNQLIRVAPWGDVSKIEGDLAKSWELSGDGLTISFDLHDGVKFQDGSSFDCADVQASMDRYLNPPGAVNPAATSLLQHITEVACPDPLTVVMTMDKVIGSTIPSIASGTVFMFSEEYAQRLVDLEVVGRNGVQTDQTADDPILQGGGTGPFMFESYEPSVKVVTKKNPNYFKAGLPFLDEVHDVQMLDSTARFAALTAGKIHQAGEGSSSLLPAQVQQVRSRFGDKVALSWTGSPGQQGFSYNQTKPPFDDPRVRKALDLVLDRQAWAKIQGADADGNFGNARISGIQAWGTQWALSDEELTSFPGYRQPKAEDIAEAQRLLKEAGYENGFEATCMTRTAQNYMDVCLFGMEQWRTTLGLDIKARFLESAAQTEAALSCNYDIYVTWSSGTSVLQDPDWTLWRGFHTDSKASGNPCDRRFDGTSYQKEMDGMMADLLTTLDPAQKKALGNEIEKSYILDSIPYSGLGWTMYNYGNSPQVRGANWYNYGTYIYHVMPEMIWLSDDGARWWEGFYATHEG